MKLAVVGAGISGLVAAHLLSAEHEVTVYEAAPRAGGHTNTVRVDRPDQTFHVDTGFIVHNDRNYPNFQKLMGRLGVATQPSNMSFSVSAEDGSFDYAANGINGLYATRSNIVSPAFQRMIWEVPRFQRACRALLEEGNDDLSLTEFLAREQFSAYFVDRLIVPQAAAVWSADPAQMESFPARFLAQFFDHHGMLSLRHRPHWRVLTGGSASYLGPLTEPFAQRLFLGAPVTAIRRDNDGVDLATADGTTARFDEVVLATHSDQALAMLGDASDTERELLGAIDYQPNSAVLHTDERLLPRRRAAWASWNYHLLEHPTDRAAVTYHMNRLQSLDADVEFCVTLNRDDAIDPAHVIARFEYAHPIFTPAAVRAQHRVKQISGHHNRTHYCGAYWAWGFHEDGVASALSVTRDFGIDL